MVFALNLLYPNLGLLPSISCFGSVTKFNTLLLVSDFVSFMTFVMGIMTCASSRCVRWFP